VVIHNKLRTHDAAHQTDSGDEGDTP